MMKTKLLFWLAFFSIGMRAQNINFPDANFKAILLSSSPSNTIAKNLSGNYFAIDANGDGEISMTEAQAVSDIKIQPKMIDFGGGYQEPDFNETDPIADYGGINYFINAISIELSRIATPTSEIIISGLGQLKSFTSGFYNSDPGKVSLTNLPNLESLYLSSIELANGDVIPQLKNLSLSYGTSPNNLFLDKIQNADLLENLTLNSDSFYFDPSEVLILNNHNNLKSVSISNIGFDNIDLSHCDQLTTVSINGNFQIYNPMQIGTLDVSDCPLLSNLNLINNASNNNSGISELIANNCSSLETIKCDSQFLQVLQANNCALLSSIDLFAGNDFIISNVPNLKSIIVQRFKGDSFDATPIVNLETLNLDYIVYSSNPYFNNFGPLSDLNVKSNLLLKKLSLNNQILTALDVSNLQNLETLSTRVNYGVIGDPQPDFNTSFLHLLNAENCISLKNLDITGQMGLLSANFKNCQSLEKFNYLFAMGYNHSELNKLNFENCSSITEITAEQTELKDLNIKNCYNLKTLSVGGNNLETLSFDNTLKIENLYIGDSKLSTIDVSSLEHLKLIYCPDSKFSTLDFSQNKKLEIIALMNNPNLESLFIKNGKQQYIEDYSGAFSNTSLKYICADDSEIEEIKSNLALAGITANVNSYCSFTPGGNFNTISGTVKIDTNNNGCDTSDNPFEFLKLKINDGTTSGETFVQQNGKYEFYTQAGNFNITALAENPALFTISPANFSTSFADSNNNVFTQDICVTANGTQNDAEIVIAPLTGARPGFDATYKLVWRNKGNTTLSGKVVINYDHNRMAFQSSSLPYSVISNGTIEFNYNNLKPYANEATELIFTINTPTNPTNPVNSGDTLSFNAQITPNASDQTPEDNNFKFDQTVVNSFDPNDITCMEGEIMPTTAVGKYMHYVVNFENTGTAEAENIVVKMKIDPAEFDINTLQLQNASADVTTVIIGNEVEFRFKKIKLKAGGHGNVLLKVRSVTNLQEGDTVDNSADIYFDYNFPITTNEYVTTILDEHSVLNAKINYEATDFTSNNYKINFDASLSTGDIVSYTWEFPNATSVSSTSDIKPTVTYNNAGNYTAKLTISDADNNLSVRTVSFKIGNTVADLSTGKDNNGNFIAVDADDDDWKGYDINGTEITPKIRTTYTGWSYADMSTGVNSRWISLNNFEGYYNYKSRVFTIPNNATDAKLNLRSLSFVRNWTYLVKVEADGSETETEITRTQWYSDGFKGWVNSRSPKVDNYALSPGTYYIKVLVYSNNSTVRESLDVNAIVTSSTGLMNANKLVPPTITLQSLEPIKQSVSVYPVPTHGELNIDSDSEILSVEVHDAVGRILQKKHFAPSKRVKFTINNGKGIYFLKIMTKQGVVNQKIIKE
ncbi:PKD domain-containing protein [Epilithonimonas sp.]|uniref:DUF7619 domain-containing protein n=1 Tax=Epilithonimonas sp. TaxID=2894511 RepID=UPI0028A0DDED|nr:PKD domain-containing protein [Epilithonimonas sp.]